MERSFVSLFDKTFEYSPVMHAKKKQYIHLLLKNACAVCLLFQVQHRFACVLVRLLFFCGWSFKAVGSFTVTSGVSNTKVRALPTSLRPSFTTGPGTITQ